MEESKAKLLIIMAVKYHTNSKKIHSENLNVTKSEFGFQIYYGKICTLLGMFIG